jgi:RNA polymerase sigma-70 factor (family 1)
MKTEREIVDELKEGKVSAFDILYKTYSHKIYCFSLSILKSKEDAEEIAQNVFLKIWEKHKSIDSELSFKSFLFTITYNLTVDLLRERLKERKCRENILDHATSNYNLEEAIEFGDLIEHIEQIVTKLPPRKSKIYEMSRVNHLSYSDIAAQLNISVKTVENSINASMKFIKSHMNKDVLTILLYTSLFL